jgi:hypothetical protein
MGRHTFLLLCAGLLLISQTVSTQPKRIAFNNQQLFLSGANLAWVNFASDIGPGSTDFNQFADILLQVHNCGGNAVRWWLHTNGVNTPQFSSDSGFVTGPGPVCIADIKKVLDLAWERKVGVNLCLWSFDMLRSSNSATVKARNTLLLNDTNYTRRYINNSLIPMVQALKGHPAIIAWEIFNEPEGMSNEFGWSDVTHVPMSSIQRFINLCAGAIHRTDASALVTNGAWSFYALTDNTLAKTSLGLSKLSEAERTRIGTDLKKMYRSSLTTDEILLHVEKMASGPNLNYYRDDRLISAGSDMKGTLDFYSVHYYSSSTPISTSPFNAFAVQWGLNKPIVVAEYAMESGHGNPPGIAQTALYDTLYHLGYAGSLPWSWTDVQFSSQAHMLAGMQSVWESHRSDVAVNGIVYDWPFITIKNPLTNTSYPDSTSLTFNVIIQDTLPISSLVFYADTTRIGEVTAPYAASFDTSFYNFRWANIAVGTYSITAVATNSVGHQKTSNTVVLSIGKTPMTRLEAETAALGAGMTVKSDATASSGRYVDVAAQDSNTVKITWYFNNVSQAGTYEIAFGYKLFYNTPKSQYINVNGVRMGTLDFTAASTTTWYEKTMSVPLVQGSNNIQMQMFWGWMYVDYLAVPRTVLTSVSDETIVPTKYSLEQNYPNPFNPSTTINFSLPKASNVKLTIFNLLGQKVTTLADKFMDAGVYSIKFESSQCASGVYFYRLEAEQFLLQKKMLLLR